ncbi:MAG: NUDIX hydrolase [Gaiellaceae bacterium]|jgi:8-oxo-dGTP diphosphatase
MAEGVAPARARGDVTVVRAAGGLVRRQGEHGPEVLLVHRPKYGDWTFPKGKADDDELDEDCALREVGEETGLRCQLEEGAGTTEYVDAKGQQKRVRWWVMRPLEDNGFLPNDEIDELRWVFLGDAARVLTYDRDVALLDRVR